MSTSGTVGQPVSTADLEQFFADISSRLESAEAKSVDVPTPLLADNKNEMEQFFDGVSYRVDLAEIMQRRLDKRLATGFNVFDLIEPDENWLSDVLALLLDPKGKHGQGDLFLRLLFEKLGISLGAVLTKEAKVQREAPTYGILKYRRLMDVLVDAGPLLAIENKVDSPEQEDQVKDYLQHLDQCTRGRPFPSVLIYLTPEGKRPDSVPHPALKNGQQESVRLECWSYHGELRAWLEACRKDCEAERIRSFLSDFIAYIQSTLKRESMSIREAEGNGK